MLSALAPKAPRATARQHRIEEPNPTRLFLGTFTIEGFCLLSERANLPTPCFFFFFSGKRMSFSAGFKLDSPRRPKVRWIATMKLHSLHCRSYRCHCLPCIGRSGERIRHAILFYAVVSLSSSIKSSVFTLWKYKHDVAVNKQTTVLANTRHTKSHNVRSLK